MKLLVTGAQGLLGSEFVRAGGIDVVGLGRDALDVTDEGACRSVIPGHDPDWVIHCAAYTAVDGAEDEAEEAMEVNHGGTVNVAAGCAAAGAGLVYVSSDYVFDGTSRTPYPTDAGTAPLSAYGRSKRAGEEAALAAGGLVVRTGWLYGPGGRNFVDAILERAAAGEALKVVDDQWGRPSRARNVAEVVMELLAKDPFRPGLRGGAGENLQRSSADLGRGRGDLEDNRVAERDRSPVWHVADRGEATWLELAREACRLAGYEVEIRGVSTEEWGARAPRPAYSVLDLSETERVLGRPMMPWREALRLHLEEKAAMNEEDGA